MLASAIRVMTISAAFWLFAPVPSVAADRSPENDPPNRDRSEAESRQGKVAAHRAIPARNLTMKTLGGRQFWGDVLFFHDWRIQKNIFTGHHRLLDADDYRHESGSFDRCRATLARIRQERRLPKMSGKAVILVHGILRSSKSLARIERRLQQEGYQVFGFDYPSTRVSIEKSAEFLGSAIESLEGIEQIDLVVHSMGGLVVRAYLQQCEKQQRKRDERLHRMVMLAVPNLGAHMADRMHGGLMRGAYTGLFGPAGKQLMQGADGAASLPVPDFEFGLVAGSRGTDDGYNPLVPGDDDGTVAIESTKLSGAADFIVVKGLHSFLMNDDDVIDCTARFLKTGRFREDGEAQPIPREKPDEAHR